MSARTAGAAVALALAAAIPAHGTPAACDDPCGITAAITGYVLPVTEIASGTQVRWSSVDLGHPTSEGPTGDECFTIPVGPSTDPIPVRFDVSDGVLRATTAPGAPDPEARECTAAVAVPDGSMLLPYRCLVHPWMNAALLITAE